MVAKVQHHPAMDWRQLPAFMKELRSVESIPAKALEFTILTAARTIETIGANWSEIDLENKVWIVPEDRMKASREHRVPLSDRSIAIINALPRLGDNAHMFPGARSGKGMSNMTMIKLLKTMRPGLTVHGFRSSFRDWAGDATLHPREVAEACLAHTVGSAVELAYRRSDALEKRRALLQDWVNYCGALLPS
jgi:integrase